MNQSRLFAIMLITPIIRGAALLFALTASFPATAARPIPDGALQWEVANDTSVNANTRYELHNFHRRELGFSTQLGYIPVSRGWPNSDCHALGWMGHSGGHFIFVRPNRADRRSVNVNETLALYNTKIKLYLTGKFHKHKRRGTVTVWKESPAYEWQVRRTEPSGTSFALYNTVQHDYYVIRGEGSLNNGQHADLRYLRTTPSIGRSGGCS